MAEQRYFTLSVFRFFHKAGNVQRYSVAVPVGDKDAVAAEHKFFFPVEVGEEVVVSCDDAAVSSCKRFYIIFSAFHIAAVDEHVEGSLGVYRLFDSFIYAVSVADDQNFHNIPFSSRTRRMARSAFPLWLILFFSSGEISAEVFP